MILPAQGICYNIGFSRMVVHFQIIVLDQLWPSMLPHVQLRLSEDVFETLVISVYVTYVSQQVMSPYLLGVNNCCKLQIMCRVVDFMLSQLSRSIGNNSTFLHEHTPKPVPDASQNTSKGFSMLGCARIGAVVSKVRRV